MVVSFRRGPHDIGHNGSDTENGMHFAAIREVRAYWEALRDDQDLPRREQINPRGIAGALHHVFIVERIAPGTARFRLAGMEINTLMGMEVRGMPISALFDPSARARLAEMLEKVATARTTVEMDLEADRGIGRPALRAKLLLLPLEGTAGETALILGCLVCDGQIGRPPRRFVIARALEKLLNIPSNLGRPMPKGDTRPTLVARPASPCLTKNAKPAAPTVVAGRPATKPYLRLVHAEG